jgi:hypothetical protein
VAREVYGDAVRYAADVPAFAAQLDAALTTDDPVRRAAGRALASRYTWTAAAQAHVALYGRLLSRSAPSPVCPTMAG